MKVAFNEFNSAVFSVYELHPMLNAFIGLLYVSFSFIAASQQIIKQLAMHAWLMS